MYRTASLSSNVSKIRLCCYVKLILISWESRRKLIDQSVLVQIFIYYTVGGVKCTFSINLVIVKSFINNATKAQMLIQGSGVGYSHI